MFTKHFARLALLVMTVLEAAWPARAGDAPSAGAIVAAADKIRNPDRAFRMSLSLIEFHSGQPHDSVNLAVHSQFDPRSHQYRNLVRYSAPARDVGKLVLLNGSSMWFYDPASKASIR